MQRRMSRWMLANDQVRPCTDSWTPQPCLIDGPADGFVELTPLGGGECGMKAGNGKDQRVMTADGVTPTPAPTRQLKNYAH